MAGTIVSEAEACLESAADHRQHSGLTLSPSELYKLEQATQVGAALLELLQTDADNEGGAGHERLDARRRSALLSAISLANERVETIVLDLYDRRQAHGSASAVSRLEPLRAPRGEVRLCVPDDQVHHLPARVTGMLCNTSSEVSVDWPAGAGLPKAGEVIYLSSTSAWGVTMVIHECRPGGAVDVQVWIEYVAAARLRVPDGGSSAIH